MPSRVLRPPWGWLIAAGVATIEAVLFAFYSQEDARSHWFTHFFVGASVALLAMAAVTLRTRRPVPVPLAWILLAHLYAAFPDVLFDAMEIAHQPWMDVFLFHVSSHAVPGLNLTWFAIFLAALACYLTSVHMGTRRGQRRHRPSAKGDAD